MTGPRNGVTIMGSAVPLQASMMSSIYGTVGGGGPFGIIDSTKNMEADIFLGDIIKITLGRTEYFRKITASVGDTFGFESLGDETKAFAVLENPEGGAAQISCDIAGADGNKYSIELIPGEGPDAVQEITLTDNLITIKSATDPIGDPIPMIAEMLIPLFENSELHGTFTVEPDLTPGLLLFTEEPVQFINGMDYVTPEVGDEYEVIIIPKIAEPIV
jgi:hypothetical protein